ncbi:MAG: hypothetical protein KGM49_01150 [Sphingomonadales bacterium]|nr:hypothetical protein [Sphingomonadales bacterium]
MVKWLARYTAYTVFVIAAPFVWLIFAYVVFGFLPLPGDPICHFEPQGCPERSVIVRAFGVICLLGSIPLTILAFVFYRKAVRRALGLPATRSSFYDR